MMKRLYLDIHALQVLPPSCVNRDDTNTPKTCISGGKVRTRVSSQCWKRAARKYMKETEIESIGIRTKRLADSIKNRLIEEYSYTIDDAVKLADITASAFGASPCETEDKNGKKKTEDDANGVIMFLSNDQINIITDFAAKNQSEILKEKVAFRDNKKNPEIKKKLFEQAKMAKTSDILLFGRMFAKAPTLNSDAACQVAHAFSVNETRAEYDYFTAVDDIPNEFSRGSAYLDVKQFTDPILYRYANINLSETSELIKYDKDNAARIASNFVKAFLLSMPTGSMNGYANATLPDYVMTTLRDDMPVSFAPAFIKTVSTDDFEAEAENKLIVYEEKISKNYGAPLVKLSLKEHSLKEILNILEREIEERL